jgi:hypothetical protein
VLRPVIAGALLDGPEAVATVGHHPEPRP